MTETENPNPRIVVFLDVHLPLKIIKKALEDKKKGIVVEVVDKRTRKKKRINNLSDSDLLEYFESVSQEKYPLAAVFLITWDRKFDVEAGHDGHKHRVFVIKTPQFNKRKPSVYGKMLKVVKNFLIANAVPGWEVQARGFIEIRKLKKGTH